MNYVRIFNKKSGLDRSDPKAWFRVSRKAYDKKKHGTELFCADSGCEDDCPVEAYARKEVIGAQGDSFDRPQTFVSKPRQKRLHHRKPGAGPVGGDGVYSHSGVNTLSQGVKDWIETWLNLRGLRVKHTLRGKFGKERYSRNLKNQYQKRRNERRHCSEVIESLQELENAVTKIRKIAGTIDEGNGKTRYDENLASRYLKERVFIGYGQRLISYPNFVLSKDRLPKFFLELYKGDEKNTKLLDTPEEAIGVPRLFRFVPTERVRKGFTQQGIFGSSFTIDLKSIDIEYSETARLVVVQRLDVKDRKLRAEIIEHLKNGGEVLVMATPEINKIRIDQKTQEADASGGRAIVNIVWPVTRDQIQLVPAKNLAPEPAPTKSRRTKEYWTQPGQITDQASFIPEAPSASAAKAMNNAAAVPAPATPARQPRRAIEAKNKRMARRRLSREAGQEEMLHLTPGVRL